MLFLSSLPQHGRPLLTLWKNRLSSYLPKAHYASQSWLPWEDAILKDYIQENGKRWSRIVQHCLPHRTASACAIRWNDSIDPAVKDGPFSATECKIIADYVSEHGVGRWTDLSKRFLPNRPPRKIANVWKHTINPDIKKHVHWTPEEDALLLEGVAKYGTGTWTRISREFLPQRTRVQIQLRYARALEPGIKTTPWTVEEQDILLRRTLMYGTDNWSKVAEGIPGRAAAACLEKWYRKVDPSNIYEPWSDESTRLFWELTKVYCGNWKKVSEYLPGRSRYACHEKFWIDVEKDLSAEFKSHINCKPDETDKEWKKRMATIMCNQLNKVEVENVLSLETVSSSLDKRRVANLWTPEEDAVLTDLVLKCTSWDNISTALPGRTPKDCSVRWMLRLQYRGTEMAKKINVRLTQEEKDRIREGVSMFGHNWKAVSSTYLPDRTPEQCMRWWSIQKNKSSMPVKRTHSYWTEQENKILLFAISIQSPGRISWNKVASMLETRTSSQCKLRWECTYNPKYRRGKWTEEETMQLVELVHKYSSYMTKGHSIWKTIAEELGTGRSNISCHGRYKIVKQRKSKKLARL
ncbi:Homeodomain-like protein [Spinellus fusiger]|nr:Homeodomain-like protein [Spinellus fusiger]